MTTDFAAAEQAAQEADSQSLALLLAAESFTIATADQFQASGEKLRDIKAEQKRLNDLRLSLTRPLDQSKARILGLFKPAADRLSEAETKIKNAMIAFQREQERKRQEAEAKLRAAEERERERLRKLADEQRERGKEKLAEKTEARVAAVPTLNVETASPKVAGVTSRKTYKAEVVDLVALVKAAADGQVPVGLLAPNYEELNKWARADKEAFSVPGVKLITEDIMVARAG